MERIRSVFRLGQEDDGNYRYIENEDEDYLDIHLTIHQWGGYPYIGKFVDPRYLQKLLKSTEKYNNLIISRCPDTKILYGKMSQTAILAAVKSVPNAIDLVLDLEHLVKRVFCNVRPPGHHASDHRASGFCFLNNVAIGAKYALTLPGIKNGGPALPQTPLATMI